MMQIVRGEANPPREGVSSAFLVDSLVCAAFLLAGMVGVVLPYVMPGRIPGDIGDARLNQFLLEHFFQVVMGGAESFTEAPLYYPWIDTIALSDTHWGTAPIYSLFRLFRLDPEQAFAAWFAVGFALNYVSVYIVFRLFGLRSLGAAAGAFLFSFGLPVLAQDGHAQLLYRFCVPWAVWALYRYMETRDARLLALTGLFVAFQLLISFYIGIFLALLLAAYMIVIVLERRPFASKWALRNTLRSLVPMTRERGPLLTAAALAVATLAILLLVALPYLEVVRLYHLKRPWWEILTMLPRPFSYLKAGRSDLWSWIPSHLNPVPMAHEHQMFFGLVPVACLVIAPFCRQLRTADRLTWQGLYALAILVVVTLNVDGFTLYVLLVHLPGLSAIRAVTRIVLVMIFPVGLIMGRVIDLGWAARLRRPYLGAVTLAASLFVVLEAVLIGRSISTIPQWQNRLEALRSEAALPLARDSILVVANQKAQPDWMREIDAMLLAQSLKATTMNGYSGNNPPGWAPMQTCADLVAVVQAATKFRKTHGEPGFSLDVARIVPIGFGDCSEALALAGRDQSGTAGSRDDDVQRARP
jgi:hypothetical protein